MSLNIMVRMVRTKEEELRAGKNEQIRRKDLFSSIFGYMRCRNTKNLSELIQGAVTKGSTMARFSGILSEKGQR